MFRTESRTIQGETYEITLFPAFEGYLMALELAKLAGPIFMLKESAGGVSNDDIAAVFAALDPKKLADITTQLVSQTICKDGELSNKNVFNSHFAGNYSALILLCVEVVQVNGFFDIIIEKIKLKMSQTAK